eukprot:6709966-Karenia_brevis.AAC.1
MAMLLGDVVPVTGKQYRSPATLVRLAATGQLLAGARRGARPAQFAAGKVERVWGAMEDIASLRRGEVID